MVYVPGGLGIFFLQENKWLFTWPADEGEAQFRL